MFLLLVPGGPVPALSQEENPAPKVAAGPAAQSDTPPSTTVIPRQQPLPQSPGAEANPESGANAAAPGAGASNSEIDDYENSQNPPPEPVPHFHSLREFMSEGSDSSPIGLELREDRRKLNTGEQADGLLVIKVHDGSPAAQAGLRGYSTTGRNVLEGAAIAAAMVFPPAVLAIAILDQTHVGESYDMIIGVDGRRVTNYIDFEDQIRDAKPGDVVYLSVVRNGKRMQIPVHLPVGAGSLASAPY